MNFLFETAAYMSLTIYRRKKRHTLHMLVDAETCLDTAKHLAASIGGELTISLTTISCGFWMFTRPRRYRVPASYRKRFGKRAARELETQLNRRSP